MEIPLILLVLVIAAALVFEFVNGFHDCANAIATIVHTRVLSPKQAVYFSASLNFIGALLGVSVAKTIGGGLVSTDILTLEVVFCALLGAIIWNIITWRLGLPSSSSHALIGGLVGAGAANALTQQVALNHAINFDTLLHKALIPMVASPITGFLVAIAIMVTLLHLVHRSIPKVVNARFRRLQLLSSGFMALSHGTNDAQKTMGIISVALFSAGVVDKIDGELQIPIYVIIACGLTMALGTMSGGWKIIKTMGSKVAKLKPIHGFAAESTAAAVIMTASHFGVPLSTTHVISSSIMGVGAASRTSKVKWGVVKTIVLAWVLTIPATIVISAVAFGLYAIF